jgi:hypothetical protein
MDKESLREMLCGEQWSNAACCGYLLLACDNLNLDKTQIEALLSSMKAMFDSCSVESAKKPI